MMPGLVASVSAIVAPPVASISRAVATVTGTKALSATMNVPGGAVSCSGSAALVLCSAAPWAGAFLRRFRFHDGTGRGHLDGGQLGRLLPWGANQTQ